MQWFKHDSSANQDVKIKKLRRKHGLMGYGLYWYIIERIQGELSLNNTSLSLEDDAEVIALDWGVDQQVIQSTIDTMLSLKLFYLNQGGQLICPSMAKRLDASMASGEKMRKLISALKTEHNPTATHSYHDTVMTEPVHHHDTVMALSCKKERRERTEEKEQNILDESVRTTSEQTDINTNNQAQQEKEVNQGNVFERALNDSARSIGGQVVPIQSQQGVTEELTDNWQPDESTTVRLQQKAIPLDFILQKLEGFRLFHLGNCQKHNSFQSKFFTWVTKDWNKEAASWKAKGQQDYRSAEATRDRLNDTSW